MKHNGVWYNGRTGCPSTCPFFDFQPGDTKQDVCLADADFDCPRIEVVDGKAV